MSRFGGPLEIATKEKRSEIVTDADRTSEAIIVRILREATPHATIYGEESGTAAGTNDERWIVDPLDGTTNFAHGYHVWGISIGYERAGVMEAGVVAVPTLGETYHAARGRGAFCNGAPIRVTDPVELAEALVCTGFKPDKFGRNGAFFAAASEHVQGVRRDGSAAVDLAFLARGRFDAYWGSDLAPYDVAAGALLVREAGGLTTTLDGGDHFLESPLIVAGGQHVQPRLRALLRAVE
jgi:myo-inositol-1(or 4)-monophosphatase